MPQDNNVKNLIINQLTKAQYQELVNNNQLSSNELYIIADDFHYTESEIIALLQNKQNILSSGEGIQISDNVVTIDLNVLYKKEEIDTLLSSKANISETAYKLIYENNVLTLKNKDDETLSVVELYELPDVDKKTISYNEEGNLQAIGERIKSGTIKYTWIGTQEEYEQAKVDNIIDEFTEVLITDSISETITPIVQYDAPTKLSDLANDLNFATQDELLEVKNDLDAKIEGGIDDSNFVHLIGNETIDGFKNFKQKIVIENGLNKGRIAHKPVGTSLEDGYIEFGDNTLLYGKQNIQGELYDEKHDIFHAGNLVAGNNITITKKDGVYKINGQAGGGTGGGTAIAKVDNVSIITQADGAISAQGVLDQNAEDLNAIKFWSGTLEEYEALGSWDNNTIYNVTDDIVESGGLIELPVASTDTLGGVKVDGKTINIAQDGVISAIIPKVEEYVLPTASTTTLGGVKVDGETITIEDGVISASSSGGGGGGVASVIEVYGNSSSGYRLWSDGYCEQWFTITNNKAGVTITLHKPYKDTSYKVFKPLYGGALTLSNGVAYTADLNVSLFGFYSSPTTTSFVAVPCMVGVTGGIFGTSTGESSWYAVGYVS